MHTLQRSYNGLSLLMVLNWDRILFITTIIFGLMAGAYLGSL